MHLSRRASTDLNPAVSVIDQTGTLLSGLSDAGATSGLDAQQLQYVSQIEQNYTKRIVELLEPVVGPDNLRASVTAEVDFSQTESTSELFNPTRATLPSAACAASRATRSRAAPYTRRPVFRRGVNQPPQAATAPSSAAPAAAGRADRRQRQRRTTRQRDQLRGRQDRARDAQRHRQRQACQRGGRRQQPQRHRRQGKTTSQPLSAGRTRQAHRPWCAGIGFNQERGDSVKGHQRRSAARRRSRSRCRCGLGRQSTSCTLAVPAVLGGVALLVMFGLVRPALKAARRRRPGPRPEARRGRPERPEPARPGGGAAAPVLERAAPGPARPRAPARAAKPGRGGRHRAQLGQRGRGA